MRTAPIFVNQLTHVILRNIRRVHRSLRAPPSCLARSSSRCEALLAADEETIAGATPVSLLVSMLSRRRRAQSMCYEENAASHFARSDQFDMALDHGGRRGLAALGEVMARYVRPRPGGDVEPPEVRGQFHLVR
jgi:hypothetical protein